MFREYLTKTPGLSDKLNYAHLVEEGIILNKDGALLTTYKFKGPDIHSLSNCELDSLTATFSRMCTQLENGWMLHIDEVRIPSISYPEVGFFPDFVSRLIDEERRELYESEGLHFENYQFITFVWKFPVPKVSVAKRWFIENLPEEGDETDLDKYLLKFKEMVERCIGLLSMELDSEALSSKDLLSYLNLCITGDLCSLTVPPNESYIDQLLSRKELIHGYVPKIGDKYIGTVTITGYLNQQMMPGMLNELGTYPLIYRWSNRFIPLDQSTACHELKRTKRYWNNKVKGFVGVVKEAITNKPTTQFNHNALQKVQDINEAIVLNENGSSRFGYWTSDIVIMHEDLSVLDQAAKDIIRYIEQSEFSCYRETINATDAWFGTIPGHGSCNVRRLFVNSEIFSAACPLHTVWAGEEGSSSASLLPKNSPPVFYAATTGKTPFRFNLDVSDVGHQVVLGPTGSGKSTYLGFLIAQFLRYQNAQIFVFDKDYSHQALTLALGGHHYDIGNADSLEFCPLAALESASQKMRAKQWIEDLVILQNTHITPTMRSEIHRSIEDMAKDKEIMSRNLTVFCSYVQDQTVRTALKFYTLEGNFKLLDSTVDSLQSGYLQTFEMGWLLSQKAEIYLPVLRHIFDQIESRVEEANSERPTIIFLEEAWLYISHPVFADKLKDWLKVMRKKNTRVIFGTQSLSDLYEPSTKSLTAITAAILESCPTKIYLPNPAMDDEVRSLYLKIGLTERQVDMIKSAQSKREYYVVKPNGNRLIELGFNSNNPVVLNFVGLSKHASKALLDCKAKHEDNWLVEWLNAHGQEKWVNYVEQLKGIERIAS